ncbi:MAG: hypothetical protein ACFFC7_13795, partial [Candidatus Hermodarchaeota archaeon]
IFGVNELAPFIINILLASITIILAYFLLQRYKIPSFFILISLTSIIFLTSLPSLIFIGMEHIFHIILTIYFVYKSIDQLSNENSDYPPFQLLIVSFLLTMTRYEGIFLIIVVSMLFTFKKRYFFAIILLSCGILPILGYGFISILNGGYLLPNSIIMKKKELIRSLLNTNHDFFYSLLKTPNSFPLIFITFIAYISILSLIAYFFDFNFLWKESRLINVIYISCTILHILFASIGWFYRYEAYLIALGIFLITIQISKYCPELFYKKYDDYLALTTYRNFKSKYFILICLLFLILIPMSIRGYLAVAETPQATKDIYQQQYQMALFVKQYYEGKGIIMNDIGAVTYFNDIVCLDLWGLASIEIVEITLNSNSDRETVKTLIREKNITIAIVYSFFLGYFPSSWINVGQWTISDTVIVAWASVLFLASNTEESRSLIENLREFSSRLPDDVVESGLYTIIDS